MLLFSVGLLEATGDDEDDEDEDDAASCRSSVYDDVEDSEFSWSLERFNPLLVLAPMVLSTTIMDFSML